MRVHCHVDGRVLAQVDIDVDRQPGHVWTVVGDVSRWMLHDPFHAGLDPPELPLVAGTHFRLLHGVLGIGFWRCGRLLEVRPGRGYSFSDLSARGRRVGFPHVYRYDVLRRRGGRSTIRVTVRGRWTQKLWPRSLVWAWLVFVTAWIRFLLRIHLAMALPLRSESVMKARLDAEEQPREALQCGRRRRGHAQG